ncbi:flagellar hook-length control protein FliK [Devosia sp.]|uniref:flagellar hook-length control protein FliK n=1 Tax=Devosia sp. TaxID=1871048 RepID=UPI00326344E2
MASHLSVSYTSSTGANVTKALGQAQSQPAADAIQGIAGLFASMLGGGTDTPPAGTTETTQTSQTSQTNVDINLAGLIGLSLDAGTDDTATDKPATDTTVDPSTVVVQQVVAALPLSAQQPAADLIQSLSELNTALNNGQAPAPELLDKLNKQLDALSQALGVPSDAAPSFDDMLKLASTQLPNDASAELKLNQKLASLAVNLANSGAATDTANTALPQQVATKLAQFAQTLANGTVPAETLNKLGLNADAPSIDPTLKTAIATLIDGKAPATTTSTSTSTTASAAAPALATPALELPASSITSKTTAEPKTATTSADAPADPKAALTTTASAKVTPSTDTAPSDGKEKDSKKSETKGIAAAVAGKADLAGDNSSTNAVGPQPATRVEAPAAAKAASTVYQTSQQQLNIPQIAFEMVRQSQHGNSRFQIRLDPAELGQIDVHLDIDKTGTVNARMVVEKSETLDLMQRDQRALQQALQQAGLDGSKTTLEFSLRQNNSGQDNQQNQGRDSFPQLGETSPAEETPMPAINLYRGNLSASGVNIFA